jgi:hypothetical protein
MSLGKLGRGLIELGVLGSMLFSYTQLARAGDFCLDCWKCPPPYLIRMPGPPRLKFKRLCPLPVCGPCDLQHFGYYPTCWSPYPYPQDYSCCPMPGALPPASCPSGIPAAPAGVISKLPEADFGPAPLKSQAPPPAAAALAFPGQSIHPSPYHGQAAATGSEFAPGR